LKNYILNLLPIKAFILTGAYIILDKGTAVKALIKVYGAV
jgi:hypothetical protein